MLRPPGHDVPGRPGDQMVLRYSGEDEMVECPVIMKNHDPFDGGHLAVATYERWRERGGRERYFSDPRALAPVVAVVVTALALLAIGLLYLDIANPIDL